MGLGGGADVPLDPEESRLIRSPVWLRRAGDARGGETSINARIFALASSFSRRDIPLENRDFDPRFMDLIPGGVNVGKEGAGKRP
jgi:hypothetical protein